MSDPDRKGIPNPDYPAWAKERITELEVYKQVAEKQIAQLEWENKGIAEWRSIAVAARNENAKLTEALREIADSTHLGNSWARHKAKEALLEKKDG